MKEEKGKTLRVKRLVYCIGFVVFWVLFVLLLSIALRIKNEQIIKVSESANVNYSVTLRENDFYDKKKISSFDEEGIKSFVGSLIESVDIAMDYNVESERDLDGAISYEVYGLLNIVDADKNELFYSKRFDLADADSVRTKKGPEIIKSIHVDYPKYNQLAKEFSDFKVSTESYFDVVLEIKKDLGYNRYPPIPADIPKKYLKPSSYDFSAINKTETLVFSIPLDVSAVSMDAKKATLSESYTFGEGKIFDEKSMVPFVSSFVMLALVVVCGIEIILKTQSIENLRTSYEKCLKRIMKEYDRLIVETKTAPNFSGLEQKNVVSFEELLDARDSIHRPINFYEKVAGKLAYFYIRVDEIAYIYRLSEAELNANKKA